MITGASTGIGYSLCKEFLNHGCRVFGSVRRQQDAERLKNDFGQNFHALLFDVTDEQAVKAGAEEVGRIIGDEGLDLLINNAGMAVGGLVMGLEVDDFRRQFEVNLFGLISVTKAFLPMLGAVADYNRKPGKIMNVSSVSGSIGYPFMAPYTASKFALEGFSDSLRRELLRYGIDVIKIAPGPVKTPIWEKSEKQAKKEINPDFKQAYNRIKRSMEKSVEDALESDELARRVYKVYRKKKPKTRYVWLNDKFKRYVVPKCLPSRVVDSFIKKLYR